MRRSCETADSSAARSSFAAASVAGRLRLGLELAELDRGRELLDECLQHALVAAAERLAREREHVLRVELDRRRALLGRRRRPFAARRLDAPAALATVEHGCSVEVEHATEAVEHGGGRRRAGETQERIRLRARPRALGRPTGRERHEPAHRHGDGEEDDEREDVLALADRERVQRRDEVPVDEEKAADGRGQRRPETADRGHQHDEQQEEEHHGRQPDLVAEGSEDPVSRSGPATASRESDEDAASRQRGRAPGARHDERLLRPAARMADDVDVDPDPRLADHPPDDGAARQALPARAAARAHDDLRDVQRTRRFEQRLADVAADDLVVRAAELVQQLALALEQRRRGRGQPVLRDHVHADEITARPLCDARGAAHEPLAVRGPRQRDEDALARLPRLGDPVTEAVLRERLVDAVGEPGERELAERGEVPRPEVVGERGVDPLRRVDVAAGEAVAQGEWREVDELDLVGAAHDVVRDPLPLL